MGDENMMLPVFKRLTLVGLFILASNTFASELETLIHMLHENGTVTDAQYERLKAELEINREQAQRQTAQSTENNVSSKSSIPVEIITKGGIGVKTTDGAFSTKLGGRLQIDAASYHGEPDLGSGTDIRRARLALSGVLYHDWAYKLEYEFDNDSITDAFLSYRGLDTTQFTVGHFKDPFSLEYMTSANNTTFLERALPSTFSAGRHIGVMASHYETTWGLSAGLFGDTINNRGGDEDEGWGWSARANWSPINEPENLIHLGLGLNYRDLQPDNTIRFNQQPETNVAGISIIDTSILSDANDMLKVGLEWAMVRGAFATQAEYIRADVDRDNLGDNDFDGWYIEGSYFLTGESRPYKNGAFGGIKPMHRLGDGGIGAWQVAMRYSNLDLTDGTIDGGEADAFTLGLNWYPVPLLRFSANYTHVIDVNGGVYNGEEPRIIQVRSQWAF